jgi:hypothetical protein
MSALVEEVNSKCYRVHNLLAGVVTKGKKRARDGDREGGNKRKRVQGKVFLGLDGKLREGTDGGLRRGGDPSARFRSTL